MTLPVPLLNLQGNINEQQLVEQLREACCDHGFFFVSGHGVPQELVSGALTALQQLFALPADTKASMHHNAHAKGYMPWGQQTLDIRAQKTGDTKETFAVMDPSLSVAAEDGGPDGALPFHSPNQWPDPTVLPGFREVMQQLVVHMKQVRDRVNQLLAQVLGQPPNFFEPYFRTTPLDMLRGFHYHSETGSDPDKGLFGAGAHTDWGHLTYLMTDGCPGLQIYHQGAWHDVPHVPGAFVCNIADLLQLWSGGRFKSSRHRVVIAPGVHRYSCAYFTVPAWNAWVQPLQPAAARQGKLSTSDAAVAVAAATATAAASDAAVDKAAVAETLDSDDKQQSGSPAGGVKVVTAEACGKPASGLDGSPGCAVLVTADGCSLAPGAKAVRVMDYIQAKYNFHFPDAGKAS